MKRILFLLAVTLLATTVVVAQSSGNFNFKSDTTSCTDTSGLLGTGSTQTALKTTIKVSSGSGVALVVRPSAVVGLLTTVSLTKTGVASSQAGVNFQVTVTPLSGQTAPTVTPNMPVTYDDRYVSISTNLFDAISTQCLALTGGAISTSMRRHSRRTASIGW